jgi:hypothetical protein
MMLSSLKRASLEQLEAADTKKLRLDPAFSPADDTTITDHSERISALVPVDRPELHDQDSGFQLLADFLEVSAGPRKVSTQQQNPTVALTSCDIR